MLAPQLVDTRGYAERFQREARAMAKMQHGNIVAAYDSGVSSRSGFRYLVMEYVDGATLFDLITRRKIKPRHVSHLIDQICDGLSYAHSLGISHLDIKPANVMVDACGTVKITDFGLALDTNPAADGAVLARLGENLGTPEYTAPERKTGGQGDRRSDIFSVGVLCYELLTGQRPRGALNSPFYTPPSRAIPGVNARYDGIVAQCIEPVPKRRLGSIDELGRVRVLHDQGPLALDVAEVREGAAGEEHGATAVGRAF